MARTRICCFVLVLLIASRGMAEVIWIGPATGAWNLPANWSTGALPNFNTAALIDDNPAQNSRVESKTSVSGGLLFIDDGDTLAVMGGTFSAGIVADGTVSVEGNSTPTLNGSMVLHPDGELRLAGTNATVSLSFLINQGEVNGGGRLTLSNPNTAMTSYNQSIIRADNPTIPLVLQLPSNANFENSGRLIASGGATLQVQHAYVSGTPVAIRGGRIEAYPGSTVMLGTATGSAYVEDAVLAMVEDTDPLTTAPIFQFYAKLTDVALEGKFKLSGADIVGTLRNSGEISPGPTTVGTYWHNDLVGEVLLTGGGTVQLGSSPYALFGTPNSTVPIDYRLINVDNVIRGSSELLVSWGGFTNRNIVQADSPFTGDLVFYNGFSPDGFVNSGVMKAINGGRLRLGYQGGSAQGALQNFEGGDVGEVIAGENSTVGLANIHINGGVLKTVGENAATRGKYVADGTVVLEDVTLEGTYRFLTTVTSPGTLSTITFEKKNYNKGSITARFAVATTAELAGGGELIGESGNLFSLSTGASFINADNLIHGTGNFTAPSTGGSSTVTRFTNRGTIRADGPMSFTGTLQVVNRGRIEAAPGITLSFLTSNSTTILNSEDGVAGTIHAAPGGIVTLRNIDGGNLSTEGTGVIRASTGVLKDVHNLGTLEVTSMIPQGTIVNDGVIRGGMQLSSPYVRFDGTGRWENAAGTYSGGTVINGPQHTILGNGDLGPTNFGGVFTNEGTVRVGELANTTFRINVSSFANSGLVHAATGRTVIINSTAARVENTGTLQVDGNMEVTSWSGLYNQEAGLINVGGKLTLKETRLRNRAGGRITGSGEIAGPMASGPLVVNEGVIEPGAGLATLTIGDDFQQIAGGQVKMEVSGGMTPSSDLLQINGAASLAGSLLVSRVGDAALVAGDSFTLLAATGGLAGTFQQLTMPTLDSSLFWFLDYAPTQMRAIVADVIPGDFNLNGSVDAQDFVWWRKNTGSPEQYDVWRANFGRTVDLGGSLGASLAQVPEPASGLLLLAGGSMNLAARRRRPLKGDV